MAKRATLGLLALAIVVAGAAPLLADFAAVSDWLKLPPGRPQLGNMHGDIAVNSRGEVLGTNKLPPASWRPGFVLSPHGVAVNADGHLFVSEFNLFGRVHRFDRR